MSLNNAVERVGIVVVHGIGEQRRFEYLEEVVRNIALALQADLLISSVQVNINTSNDAAYRAEYETWRGESTATAVIEVKNNNGKLTNLEFREVWWSDLDEPNSFRTFLDFWCWGLSLWSKPPYDDSKVGTASIDMRLPGRSTIGQSGLLPDRDQPLQILHSLYLFLVSSVIFLLLPLLWVLGRALRSILGFNIRPDILVEYLGDVKLYQQDARIGKKLLVDLGNIPPRASIRRRVVSAYVEMALEDYERWYILSHSLGTIVAFNGLMETEKALPNYLEKSLWKKWCNKRPNHFKFKNQDNKKALTEEDTNRMMPTRPNWIELDNIIDRKELFSKLNGFMTYGSPLSKFAVLWPSIVSINQDESVFNENCEWINVFDPTDPVSDFTRFFDSIASDKNSLTPKEVPYKADKIHLLSHGEYLTFSSKRSKNKNSLVQQISSWLVSGNNFEKPPKLESNKYYELVWPESKVKGKDSFLVSTYFALGIFVWFILGVVISLVLSWLFPWFLDQILSFFAFLNLDIDFSQLKKWLSFPPSYVFVTILIVFLVGGITQLLGLNKNRVDPFK